MSFKIKINDTDVTDFVVAFDGVTQQAEGDLLHSFFLDKAETTFCLAMLDEFDNIDKENVKIYFQKDLVFFGFVVSKNINREKEEVKLTYNSFGYELGKCPLSFYIKGLEQDGNFVSDKTKEDFKERAFTTLDTEKGDTIEDMVKRLAEYGYYAMKYKGFDVGQAQVDVVDNVDFIPMRSIRISHYVDTSILNEEGESNLTGGLGIYRETFKDNNKIYYATDKKDLGILGVRPITLWPININRANGNIKIDQDNRMELSTQAWADGDGIFLQDKAGWQFAKYQKCHEASDEMYDEIYNAIVNDFDWGLDTKINKNKVHIRSISNVSDYYYIIYAKYDGNTKSETDNEFRLISFSVVEDDRFRYEYSSSTEISSILKAIAKVSDSILYITPDRTIKLKDRKPDEWAPDIKKEDLVSFDYSTEEYYTRSFNFPSGIKALDTERFPIKTNVNEHYNLVLNGKRTIFNYEIKSEGNEGERMLKNQKVANIYCGVVKKMFIKGETILIKSESQHPYFETDKIPNPFD